MIKRRRRGRRRREEYAGTKGVSQNHRLSFDDNKVLKSQLDMLNIFSSVNDHNQNLIHGGSV